MAEAQDIKLLYEPNAPDYRTVAQQSLFDKLAPDPSLSTFLDILTRVDDIFDMFNNTESEPFTVFCPVNSAFGDHANGDIRANLKYFLLNHIVPSGKLDQKDLRHTQKLNTMLEDQTIRVHHHVFLRKTVLNDKATVDTADPIEAINGIAYRIDQVLRPVK
ncbi:FAS1 domain-containing protein [Phycomyces nitens]|nr:FAS1 domain-containing protein [Phycomyces nitens]